MCRLRSLLVALLLVLPTTSSALQLHWSNGADTLTLSSATRCTLVVQADLSEGRLPPEWRLLWVADSLSLQFVAMDSLEACLLDQAQVSRVHGPWTPADSAANLTTAYLCSDEGNPATIAWQMLDLPAGGHGKLKAVALDPGDPDSSRVLESNEVTFNGGVYGDYPPALLLASSTHESTELRVSAVGSGLTATTSLRVGAPDNLWNVPLTITSKTDASLIAVADVPAVLPAAVLITESSSGAVALAPLAADRIDQVAALESSLPDTVMFFDPDWSTGWYPKDFSFFYNVVPTGNSQRPWLGLFHLMYIRAKHGVDGSDSVLAHAWSQDLIHWGINKHAFAPRHNGGWEDKAIWAPTLIPIGDSCAMFYTGVDRFNNQRIGYAKTALFDSLVQNENWQRQPNFIYSASNTGWANPQGTGYNNQQQFRDPLVMPDPDNAGRFLMFNVGQDKNWGMSMVVGVARNVAGTLNQWLDRGSYRSTDSLHTATMVRSAPSPSVIESPLVMRDSSGTGPWRMFVANAGYNSADSATIIVTQSPSATVIDTTLGLWPALDNLYTYLGNNGALVGWQACEHLQVGKIHLFAGFNGDGIAITRTYWDPTTKNFVIGNPLVVVPQNASDRGVHFALRNYAPGQETVRFELEAPGRPTPHLAVYDVAGRMVLTLSDGKAIQGRYEWRWDRRDERGASVSSGVYFARLTGVGTAHVLRVLVLR